MRSVGWAAAIGLLLLVPQAAEAVLTVEVHGDGSLAPSIFGVYEQNERDGVPNYITEDLLLASYGLIRVHVAKAIERERYLPQLERLVAGLREALDGSAGEDAASRANRDYLAVLDALLAGRGQVTDSADAKRAQAELDLVLAAEAIAASPLWGYRMDYGQFRPRGHYEGDQALTRYFRAARYAGAALFAVKPSRATGVNRALAKRMAGQAEQLARLIDADEELNAVRQALLANLAWRFGPAEDLTLAAVLAVPSAPARTHAARLFEHAKAKEMLPRILGGVVDKSRLRKDVSALDALAGWRLLPQRRTVDYMAFQRLVFDGTGAYEGVAQAEWAPFGLAHIDGQAVKGFPLLGELMSLWGSARAWEALVESGEVAFAGYREAAGRAGQALAEATGLAALHQQLLQTGFAQPESATRHIALRAFWTWQRYAALLHAKQSYTPAGKGLPANRARGARIEPSLALYQSLARVVEGHREHTPHPSWDAFADALTEVIGVASRQYLLGHLTAEEERFLNGLDAELKRAAGGGDWPIVVDVHVNPTSGQVVQEATGLARVVVRPVAGDPSQPQLVANSMRGARFTQHEFKHPLADRLTDTKWRAMLTGASDAAEASGERDALGQGKDARSAAVADARPVPLADKLGAHLLALVEDHAAGDLERASSYAQSKGLDLREDRVAVQVLAASEQDASSLERRIKSVGGNVQSRFENSIFAAIPLPALAAFAENDTVWRIDAQRRAFSPQTPGDARPQQTWEEDK